MKKINLKLKYTMMPDELKVHPRPALVSELLVRALVAVRYPQGMNGTEADMWSEVLDAMREAASEDGNGEIEIEDSVFKWLLGVVNWDRDNSKIPPVMASWARTLLNHLEEVKVDKEHKLKAVEKEKKVATE